jgi:hypothetical protein
MQRSRFTFWFYVALISILVIAFVYYQGLTSDVKAVAPYLVQLGSLAQGRNPYSGNFSQYPSTATPVPSGGAGPSHGQVVASSNRSQLSRSPMANRLAMYRRRGA